MRAAIKNARMLWCTINSLFFVRLIKKAAYLDRLCLCSLLVTTARFRLIFLPYCLFSMAGCSILSFPYIPHSHAGKELSCLFYRFGIYSFFFPKESFNHNIFRAKPWIDCTYFRCQLHGFNGTQESSNWNPILYPNYSFYSILRSSPCDVVNTKAHSDDFRNQDDK